MLFRRSQNVSFLLVAEICLFDLVKGVWDIGSGFVVCCCGGVCRVVALCGLLDLFPALDSLLLEAGHVELNQVAAVLVVVDTLGTVALLQLLLDNAALHSPDPGLTNGKSTGTENS